MSDLGPHPSRDKWTVTKEGAEVPQPWNRWFEDLRKRVNTVISDTASLAWASINKSGSNLVDLETKNHADLDNLNTAGYTHLTANQASELTGGGDTTLHTHSSSASLVAVSLRM